MLTGTGTKSPFRFYLKDDDGTYSQHEYQYPGYQIRIPAADEDNGAARLPLQETVKYISRGYHTENAPVEKLNYTKYLARKSWKESKLAQLYSEAESKCSLRSSAVAVPFLNGRFPTQNGRSFFNQVT